MKIPTLAQAEQAFFQLVSTIWMPSSRTIRSDGEFELYEDAQSTIFRRSFGNCSSCSRCPRIQTTLYLIWDPNNWLDVRCNGMISSEFFYDVDDLAGVLRPDDVLFGAAETYLSALKSFKRKNSPSIR